MVYMKYTNKIMMQLEESSATYQKVGDNFQLNQDEMQSQK